MNVPVRGWESMREMSARLLKQRTGEDLATWNRRIRREHFSDRAALRLWLEERGVSGYARSLLEMECFGYPEFLTASADSLIDAQYEGCRQLRPVFDAVVAATCELGEVAVQARKTYVSLVSPKRTFARIKATARTHVDVALRLAQRKPGGRLEPSRIHESMPLQIRLRSLEDIDSEALELLRQAYNENS